MENYNYINRKWKVVLYQNDLWGGEKRVLIVLGTMVDVFVKIKNAMDSKNYNYIKIEEVE